MTLALAATVARRRPPFTREVIAARRASEAVNVHVHVGPGAWRRAERRGQGGRMVVPLDLDHDPDDYDFRCLAGLAVTVIAIDADPVLARQVAIEIIEQGRAALVALLLPPIGALHQRPESEYFYGRTP